MTQPQRSVVIRGARVHNLQNISLNIPRDQLVVITGLSGSGKSSLAFDTIYAEGQRRYLESMSAYARQFLGVMERPDVDYIDGLSPVIAIGQKAVSSNPRSTVGTVTEVYDFLRLLFARVGTLYSPVTGKPLRRLSKGEIISAVFESDPARITSILAPVVRGRKGENRKRFARLEKQGFNRVRIDGKEKRIVPGMGTSRYKAHDIEVVVDRLKVHSGQKSRINQSVATALAVGAGTVILSTAGKEDRVLSTHRFDPATGKSYRQASPGIFSFNSPYGWCKHCTGRGLSDEFDDKEVIDPEKTIREGGLRLLRKGDERWLFGRLESVGKVYGFTLDTPLEELSPEAMNVVLHGSEVEVFDLSHLFFGTGSDQSFFGKYQGLYPFYRYRLPASQTRTRRWIKRFMRTDICPECDGTRLNENARSYRIAGYSIADLASMDIASLSRLVMEIELGERQRQIAAPILKEIVDRLAFMNDVGVGYLNLNRTAHTLAGGESQRIRLATQIGTQLTDVLYVLDEPSIGLHPRDNRKLIASLKLLRDMGNSVIVVEHDREMIENADYVIDLGPGAGEHGGHVVSAGGPHELAGRTNGMASLTAEYLKGAREIAVPAQRRVPDGKALVLKGAAGHNLKGDTLVLPLGLFVCVTGVSGSGKSSLVIQTLQRILNRTLHRAIAEPLEYRSLKGAKHLKKVVAIDQRPIGRTPRSNPATYSGLFTPIRDLFALVPESQIRGYSKGRYSFNVKGGRCESCERAGLLRLVMNFLPDVYVTCEHCDGKRYNKETLEVRYKGRSIADVLEMTVGEALEFFKDLPRIARKLRTLHSVGLGYIRLGQQSTTISGGEAQRVKLSKELSRPGRGDTLYILDEPTTGLHFEDIRYLLAVLQALVDKGNTVLVIEHNMDVIKVADYIIDMGPEGGEDGGRILCVGSPEDLAKLDTHTGVILKEVLAGGQSAS